MVKLALSLVLIFGLSALVSSACDFSHAICSSASISCPSTPSYQVNGKAYGLSNLDVISFNDLTINHGDTEGRVAVRNNFYGTNGISAGSTISDTLGYTLIVGRDLSFNDGQIFPLTSSIFVGGSASAPSYISGIDSCSSLGAGNGCLDSTFDSLYSYWSQFSATLSAQSNNVVISYQDAHAILTCNGPASDYFIHISGSDFSQITAFCTVGCSSSANFIFNIIGDVNFQGDGFQFSGLVVYNIINGGTVTVSTSIYGNVIAPNSNINMVGGTIYGTVVAGNFTNVIQINEGTCAPARVASKRSDSFCDSLIGSVGSSSSSSTSAPASDSATSTGDADITSTSASSSTGVSGTNVQGESQSGAGNNENDSGAASMTLSLVLVTLILIC